MLLERKRGGKLENRNQRRHCWELKEEIEFEVGLCLQWNRKKWHLCNENVETFSFQFLRVFLPVSLAVRMKKERNGLTSFLSWITWNFNEKERRRSGAFLRVLRTDWMNIFRHDEDSFFPWNIFFSAISHAVRLPKKVKFSFGWEFSALSRQ